MSGIDTSVRWIVATNAPSQSALERFLYANSTRIRSTTEGRGRQQVHLVVVTTQADVDFMANYQADRLRSGLIAASVYDTYDDATAKIIELLDAQQY